MNAYTPAQDYVLTSDEAASLPAIGDRVTFDLYDIRGCERVSHLVTRYWHARKSGRVVGVVVMTDTGHGELVVPLSKLVAA